jgi:hypothetical protein
MNQHNYISHSLTRSTTWIVLSLILIASGCAGSGIASGRTSSQPVFAGMWEGTFDAGEMAGGMKLVLNYEDKSYSGMLQVDMQGEIVSGPVYNFESEGNSFTFDVNIEDIDVIFEGTVEGEKMTGVFEAFMGSELVAEGTFYFTRKL